MANGFELVAKRAFLIQLLDVLVFGMICMTTKNLVRILPSITNTQVNHEYVVCHGLLCTLAVLMTTPTPHAFTLHQPIILVL